MLPKILVVDDDRYTRTLIEQMLGNSAQVHLASDGDAARELFAAHDFNLVLMDQRLPRHQGLDLLREFRAQRPRMVAILMTGFADVRDAVAAVREGLFDYLTKPFEDLRCAHGGGAVSRHGAFAGSDSASSGAGYHGAAQASADYFEKANGGNLFLDEIADMSPKLQSSLLRVLQDHSFCRIGSTQPRSTDFRLICATNRSLAGEVKAGRFREDLYYRINVVAMQLPPLREREGDVFRLAVHFLEFFNAKFGKQCGPFSPAALAALEAHPWPGNVRELRHCIERVVALQSGGVIDAVHLCPDCSPYAVSDSQALIPPAYELAYQGARASFEQEYLKGLLAAASGNVSEAARLSGIPRQNLYVRMKRWGIVTET